MDDPNMNAYGDHYQDDSEVPGAHPPTGHPLNRLAARLGELLDEDHWAECEALVLQAWQHDAIDRKTGSDWRQNSSLEVWFPLTAEELGRWRRAAEANIEENVRLRAEVERKNAALRPFSLLADRYDPPEGDDLHAVWCQTALPLIGHLRAARAALTAQEAPNANNNS